MTRLATAWLSVLVAALTALADPVRGEDEAASRTTDVLRELPEPSAALGFYVRGAQRFQQAGRAASLPVTLTAFPLREGSAPAWSLRQEVRRKPVLNVDEVVIGRDHRPIRGTARSEQGAQKQSLRWWLEDDALRYEVTDPAGQMHEGSVRVTGPVVCNGPGLVLFLRQLRPRTGTYSLSLLAPDTLVQVGLVPVTLEVTHAVVAGHEAYVGEARLRGALHIRVVLDSKSGALRALETHVLPSDMRSELTDLRDRGVAEVHNQAAAALELRGELRAALTHSEAARKEDPEESAYPLRSGAIQRRLAKDAPDGPTKMQHTLAAALASAEAARLLGEGLRTGRLASDSAASFRTMQALLYQQAGHELLEVLAADLEARTLHGHGRSFLETQAAQALVAWALLDSEDAEQALAFAGKVAQGLAEQNAVRLDPASKELAALAAQAYGALAQRRAQDAQVWQDLGKVRYLTGDDPGAIAALERCLALRPKSPTARVFYGAALWRSRRPAEARRQLAILDRVGARQQARTLRKLTGMN